MFSKFLGSIERFWAGLWTEMENFIEESGHRILQNLINSLKQYDAALSNSGLFTLEGV